jgi:hypothetical protein
MAARQDMQQPERAATVAAHPAAAAPAGAVAEQRSVVRVPGDAAAAPQGQVPAARPDARAAAVRRVAAAWRVRAPLATPERWAPWEAWEARVLDAADGEAWVVRKAAAPAGAQEPAE